MFPFTFILSTYLMRYGFKTYLRTKSIQLAAAGAQQFAQISQAFGAQMAQLFPMSLLDGFIEPLQHSQTLRCDPNQHRSPVPGLTAARDQAPLFHPVEQARDIWIPRNHAIADFTATQAIRRASQDPEYIVLRGREILSLQHARGPTRQYVRRPHQIEKGGLFPAAFGFRWMGLSQLSL
ncbi:MAG TPA: hypothetical protein VL135_07710 [Terracidiphilus sp.]|jgi:hypothetical protein|nr:hypothetical protein [Terracidiphilus sp.]